jgi:hypothetical protein
MYEYLKAKSFSPMIFSFGPWFICIATLESEKPWPGGLVHSKKSPLFFIIATAADLLSQEVKHAVIPTSRREGRFHFTPVYKKCFSHIGSLLPRRTGLASGTWTALDGPGRHWMQEADGGEGTDTEGANTAWYY